MKDGRMNRRVLLGLAAAVLALLVARYAASPLLAMGALQKAARTGDRDRLEELVDFPSVRQSLKDDFTAGLMAKAQADKEMRDNPFAGLAAMFVPALVDRIVDAAITPSGIARLAAGDGVASPAVPAADRPAAKPKPADKPKLTYRYSSLNRFRVDQPTDSGPMTWVFARRGPFTWRLVRIELPAKMFAAGAGR
jgi:hypothetical protein